jgi:hypothetical protein
MKIKQICIGRRPQNILEGNQDLANLTKHHVHEIQRIRPLVSGRSPISPTSLDISHIWVPIIATEARKLHTDPSSVQYVGQLCFYVGTIQRIFSLVMATILRVL